MSSEYQTLVSYIIQVPNLDYAKVVFLAIQLSRTTQYIILIRTIQGYHSSWVHKSLCTMNKSQIVQDRIHIYFYIQNHNQAKQLNPQDPKKVKNY